MRYFNCMIKNYCGTMPIRISDHSPGFYLYAAYSHIIHTNQKLEIETEIIIEIPNGYYGRIIGPQKIIGPTNTRTLENLHTCEQIITSDNKNTIKVNVINYGREIPIFYGDVIGQIIFEKLKNIELIHVNI